MKSYCLQTHYLPEDHIAVNISEMFSETLQQWKLEENRPVGINTDSGSNIKAACEILGRAHLSVLDTT